MSHDENVHHLVPHNPLLVAPTPSKNKLNPSTKKLYGCDPVPPDLTASHLCQDKSWLGKRTDPIAKKTCRACAVPNRYFIRCHELLPQFLSQIGMSADVLRESDLLQETVSDVSEYMLHEANNPIDSGYHSPEPMVPVNQDASSNPVSMVPVSTNKVPCPFPKGRTLVDLPGNKNEVLSPVLCKDTGCPDVKFPGRVLPLASTPRVSSENLTSAHSIFTPLGKFETFAKPNYSTPCNCIVGPIEEKVLSSPMVAWLPVTPVGLMDIQRTVSLRHQYMSYLHQPITMPLLPLMSQCSVCTKYLEAITDKFVSETSYTSCCHLHSSITVTPDVTRHHT